MEFESGPTHRVLLSKIIGKKIMWHLLFFFVFVCVQIKRQIPYSLLRYYCYVWLVMSRQPRVSDFFLPQLGAFCGHLLNRRTFCTAAILLGRSNENIFHQKDIFSPQEKESIVPAMQHGCRAKPLYGIHLFYTIKKQKNVNDLLYTSALS